MVGGWWLTNLVTGRLGLLWRVHPVAPLTLLQRGYQVDTAGARGAGGGGFGDAAVAQLDAVWARGGGVASHLGGGWKGGGGERRAR